MRHAHLAPFVPPVSADVAAEAERLVRTRREIHAHPEVGFEEVRTSALVQERLRALGIPFRAGIVGTGVVGLLEGRAPVGNGGRRPTLMLRADMDALPIQEEAEEPFASRVPGRMHACGHDGHTAILLSAAAVLAGRRERLAGDVKLVFQPAEEDPGGAKPMIDAGVLRDPDVDAAVALHLWTQLPAGTLGTSHGPMMASADEFTIDILGRGGHAAAPHTTIDPVVTAAHVVTALQTVVSRTTDPLESAVLTIARIDAGAGAYNVIPEAATLRGTARSFHPDVRAAFPARIERVVKGVCEALGAGYRFRWQSYYPPTVNDPRIAAVVADEARALLGAERVFDDIRSMGAEDMSFFLREVPGCFFFWGAANPARGIVHPHHNPRFRIDEDVLAPGVELLARCSERLLREIGAGRLSGPGLARPASASAPRATPRSGA